MTRKNDFYAQEIANIVREMCDDITSVLVEKPNNEIQPNDTCYYNELVVRKIFLNENKNKVMVEYNCGEIDALTNGTTEEILEIHYQVTKQS